MHHMYKEEIKIWLHQNNPQLNRVLSMVHNVYGIFLAFVNKTIYAHYHTHRDVRRIYDL